MRRMILTSLVLLPVMAHAQAVISTGAQPSTSSANLYAEVYRPAAPTDLAAAAPSVTLVSLSAARHASIRESVQTRMVDDFTANALHMGGALEYSMKSTLPTQSSAPMVTKAVEISLSDQELSEQPAVSRIVVRAIVDENGIPRNVAVTQSTGSTVVDRKAVAAVNEYRFKPAMVDNKPTWATVSIAIQIQKP